MLPAGNMTYGPPTDAVPTSGFDVSATGGRSGATTGTGFSTSGYGLGRQGAALDGPWGEMGSNGNISIGGFIQAAYNAELRWPWVKLLYDRLRRADPEIAVVRQIYETMASGVRIEFKLPEGQPSDDDQRFCDFGNSMLGDLEGTIDEWKAKLVTTVPFMGWGWWEAVPGLRKRDWTPPDPDDPWRSKYDDGLIGFRRLGWRDHTSFYKWNINEYTGRVYGMMQLAIPNPLRNIPLERSVHIRFGDSANPEGLSPLEAVWRLERIKYALELVQGIGFEHAAGHLSVTKTEKGEMTEADKQNIRNAARSILTAQEGNYAAWPFGFTAAVVDVPFSAASSVLEAIRYYGLLKLAVYNMQWVALSSITGTGSFAAVKDSSSMWLLAFNAMIQGFVSQLDTQFGARLLDYNRAAFPNITQRPKITATSIEKFLDLAELGSFVSTISGTLPLGEEDYLAIRRKSGFLPETLPENPADAAQAAAQDATDEIAEGDAGGTDQNTTSAESDGADAIDQMPMPGTGDLAARYREIRRRSSAILELVKDVGNRGGWLVELTQDFTDIRSDYQRAVYDAILEYLVRNEAGSTAFKNSMKQAVVNAFPDVFYSAYAAGGGEDVDPEDDQWLTDRMNQEIGYINDLFSALKGIKDEQLAPKELVAEAQSRSEGYTDTLGSIYSQGLLRGQKNKMLTWNLGNTEKHCSSCLSLDGQRHSAKWFLNRNYIPRQPGSSIKCGGWQCDCSLRDDEQVVWIGG